MRTSPVLGRSRQYFHAGVACRAHPAPHRARPSSRRLTGKARRCPARAPVARLSSGTTLQVLHGTSNRARTAGVDAAGSFPQVPTRAGDVAHSVSCIVSFSVMTVPFSIMTPKITPWVRCGLRQRQAISHTASAFVFHRSGQLCSSCVRTVLRVLVEVPTFCRVRRPPLARGGRCAAGARRLTVRRAEAQAAAARHAGRGACQADTQHDQPLSAVEGQGPRCHHLCLFFASAVRSWLEGTRVDGRGTTHSQTFRGVLAIPCGPPSPTTQSMQARVRVSRPHAIAHIHDAWRRLTPSRRSDTPHDHRTYVLVGLLEPSDRMHPDRHAALEHKEVALHFLPAGCLSLRAARAGAGGRWLVREHGG